MLSLDTDVIFLGDNFGIAYATNVAVQRAEESGYEYCALLDQDSIVCEHYFAVALSIFDDYPANLFAVGPFMENESDVMGHISQDIYEVRTMIQSGAVVRVTKCSIVGARRSLVYRSR